MTTYIGIDPGMKGGVAVVECEDGVTVLDHAEALRVTTVGRTPMVDTGWFVDLLCREHPDVIAIEGTVYAPSSRAIFTGGAFQGSLHASAQIFRGEDTDSVRILSVQAAEWKKSLGLTMTKEDKKGKSATAVKAEIKERAFDLATEIFGPRTAQKYWPRKKDEGVMEAALIAWHAMSHGAG